MNVVPCDNVMKSWISDYIRNFCRDNSINVLWFSGLVIIGKDKQDVTVWQASLLVLLHPKVASDATKNSMFSQVFQQGRQFDLKTLAVMSGRSLGCSPGSRELMTSGQRGLQVKVTKRSGFPKDRTIAMAS